MPVYDLFSRRKKQLEGTNNSEPYKYDDLPESFRVQVVHILKDAIGRYQVDRWGLSDPSPVNQAWEEIYKIMVRELGRLRLHDGSANPEQACLNFILTEDDTDHVLDIIELSVVVIDRVIREQQSYRLEAGIEQDADDAIEELNQRFSQHGLGFRYENGRIVRVDSEYIHSEAVKPALTLLNTEGFDGAFEEFLRAHEHYRGGRTKEAIAEANKAFESTMKSICHARNWQFPSVAAAKSLIDVLLTNGLIPSELTSHFTGLRTTLESGLPTVRNRQGGHGQGTDKRKVPHYVAAYALHLAATNIVFLIEAHKAA